MKIHNPTKSQSEPSVLCFMSVIRKQIHELSPRDISYPGFLTLCRIDIILESILRA